MLVLSRSRGETITIALGDIEVIVMITKIGHHKVRVGIKAPKQVAVHRTEIAEAIAAKLRSFRPAPAVEHKELVSA